MTPLSPTHTISEAEGPDDSPTGRGGRFPVTRWSVILAAGGDSTGDARAALEGLCKRYGLPVYLAIRGSGFSPEDAEDLTQEFFGLLLRREDFAKATPEKGRFRNFLLTALKRFLINERRNQKRQKRGGGVASISIDRELAESRVEISGSPEEHPDRIFERHWARELIDGTLRELQEICEREGKGKAFAVLGPYLAGADASHTYSEIARELGIGEAHARSMMFRLRNRFRRLLREAIADTLDEESSVEDEIRYLFSIFSR